MVGMAADTTKFPKVTFRPGGVQDTAIWRCPNFNLHQYPLLSNLFDQSVIQIYGQVVHVLYTGSTVCSLVARKIKRLLNWAAYQDNFIFQR